MIFGLVCVTPTIAQRKCRNVVLCLETDNSDNCHTTSRVQENVSFVIHQFANKRPKRPKISNSISLLLKMQKMVVFSNVTFNLERLTNPPWVLSKHNIDSLTGKSCLSELYNKYLPSRFKNQCFILCVINF